MKPISNTAFYCCGIRMLDAQSLRPVCGDQYAKRFMDARGLAIFREFGGESGPNISNVARHRYIDDFLRAELVREPRLQVILIGCGFDSRAFRLTGGTWLELDEPQLIAHKNATLPAAEAPNPLQRIPVDFATDSLEEKLRPLKDFTPTIFVIEGVTMYLPVDSLLGTLEVLKRLFPGHRIIADQMTSRFVNSYGRNIKRIIASLGAHMIPPEDPALPFRQAGYRELSSEPIVGLALRYRSHNALSFILRLVLPGLYSGYTMRVYQQP
jgi:methyltransferase (TIGR00027 family)